MKKSNFKGHENTNFAVECNGHLYPLDYDNIQCRCPVCGKFHSVDFETISQMDADGDLDLYAGGILCDECSVKPKVQL